MPAGTTDPLKVLVDALVREGVDVSAFPKGAVDRAWAETSMVMLDKFDFYRGLSQHLDAVIAVVEEMDPALVELAREKVNAV
jgi:hypothetical protein